MKTQQVANLIPQGFADESKVWIYQSSRPFIEKEQKEIDEQLYQFYIQWMSHGDAVKGWAKLVFNQFIVVIADDTDSKIGGCSTDGMVRVIKSIERQYDVNLFDRLTLTFLVNDKSQMLPFSQVQYAIDKGYINEDTLTFNNTVTTKKELLENWLIPVKESWLATRVSFAGV